MFGPILYAGNNTTEEYCAVMSEGKKIGYIISTCTVGADKVVTCQKMKLTIGRGGFSLVTTSTEINTETPDGKPLEFESIQDIGGMRQKSSGRVLPDGRVEVKTELMGNIESRSFDLPAGAIMFEGMRLLQTQKGLAKGTSYEALLFSSELAGAAKTGSEVTVPAKVTVGDMKDIDLFGRVVQLAEVQILMEIPGQTVIKSTSYVDNEYRPLKTVTEMAGLKLEFVACDKDFALSPDDVVDFLAKLFVQSPSAITNVPSVKSITYELVPAAGAELKIPSGACQAVQQGKDGRILVTVKAASPPAKANLPYKGTDPELLEAMEPTQYLQSDSREIIELAGSAVGNTSDVAQAAAKIADFVGGYINTKDLSVGYASALEVAKSRQGDCSEHAVLTAAMCRAKGIPARVVFGIVYVDDFLGRKNVFGGHAWTQVWVGDKWLDIDATRAPGGGFGPDYIALCYGNGNPTGFFAMVNTIGYFRIEKVTVEENSR